MADMKREHPIFQKILNENPSTSVDGKFAIVFSGQPPVQSVWKKLMDNDIFSETVRSICDQARSVHGLPLDAALGLTGENVEWESPEYSHPAIFCVEVATYEAFTLRPHYVVGHGLGEFAAAVAAKVITWQCALALVVARAKIMRNLHHERTGVTEIFEDQATVEALLKENPHIKFHVIAEKILSSMEFRPSKDFNGSGEGSRVPQMISTVTGEEIRPQYGALDANYWSAHCSSPILFDSAIRKLPQNTAAIVALGLHGELAPIIRECIAHRGDSTVVLSCIDRDARDLTTFYQTLAAVINACGPSLLGEWRQSVTMKSFPEDYRSLGTNVPDFQRTLEDKSCEALGSSARVVHPDVRDLCSLLGSTSSSFGVVDSNTTEPRVDEHYLRMFSHSSTFVDVLANLVESYPSFCYLSWLGNDGTEAEDRRKSFLQLAVEAMAISKSIAKQGIRPGDRVALVFFPCVEFVVTLWACFIGGYIPIPMFTPMNLAGDLPAFNSIIKCVGAKWALSHDDYWRFSAIQSAGNRIKSIFSSEVINWPKDLQWIYVDSIIKSAEISIAPDPVESVVKELRSYGSKICDTSIAYLQLTSGSTAVPKAVMVRHKEALRNIILSASVCSTLMSQQFRKENIFSCGNCPWKSWPPTDLKPFDCHYFRTAIIWFGQFENIVSETLTSLQGFHIITTFFSIKWDSL
jgi:hypothetical protein